MRFTTALGKCRKEMNYYLLPFSLITVLFWGLKYNQP